MLTILVEPAKFITYLHDVNSAFISSYHILHIYSTSFSWLHYSQAAHQSSQVQIIFIRWQTAGTYTPLPPPPCTRCLTVMFLPGSWSQNQGKDNQSPWNPVFSPWLFFIAPQHKAEEILYRKNDFVSFPFYLVHANVRVLVNIAWKSNYLIITSNNKAADTCFDNVTLFSPKLKCLVWFSNEVYYNNVSYFQAKVPNSER